MSSKSNIQNELLRYIKYIKYLGFIINAGN